MAWNSARRPSVEQPPRQVPDLLALRQSLEPAGGNARLTPVGAGYLAAELGVAFTTAQRAIERLRSGGIVEPAGEARRNRVYCARTLLEILEEPPISGG